MRKNRNKAFSLSAILNSTPVRVFLQSFSAKARGGWFSHFSWSVGLVPIPINIMQLLKKIGKDIEQENLDSAVGTLYGLNENEIEEMHRFHSLITSVTTSLDFEEEETED